MAAEGGVLQPMSEKIMHEEIENIRFDHIQKVKEDEASPEHSYDTSMKMGDSKPVPLQSFEILRDGHSEASAAATQDNDIISDKAKDENLHQVTTEIVGNTEGQIFNEAPSGIQDSLQENCKDADAGFQLESQNRAEKMPEDANMKPITFDEVTKEDELKETKHMNLISSDVPEHVLADKGPENGTVCEVSAKSSQDMNVVKDESEGIEDNEGMTEHEITEKKISETEIPEMLTSEIKGVKLTEDCEAEPEDASPDLKDVMKDVGEELLTKNEETIGKVDLAKQDVNKAADLEEEPKIHESTPAAIEEIVGKEDKPKESSNAALEEEGSETQDTTEEQDKPIEGDTSVQESATELAHSQLPIEKSPVPSTTETEDSTEEQYQAKEEGDASAQVPASEPPHFQSSNEKSLADISRSTTEDQFTEGDARKIMLLSEERAGEEEKLEEFCYEVSAEPGTETQDATEGHNKPTEVADASPQKPAGELLHLELPIEKFTVPSTTDDQHDIDDGGELAPGIEEQVTEEEKLKESSNAESGEPGTETQDSTEEQDKETEEGDASAHMTTGELPHFQMSIKNPLASMGISTLTTEAQLTEDDVKELKLTEDSQAEPEDASPDFTDGMKDVGEETLAENEESIDKVDLVKQDVNKEADLEEEEKNHKLTPAAIEEMVGEEDMPKESSNAALEGPGSKTQDATEEKVKETEGDTSAQKFATEVTHLQLPIEKSPMPSTAETEDSTEEQQYQATAGDASSQMLASELPHLQSSIENPLVHISTSTIEDHFKEDDENKIIPSLSEERVGEEKKRQESSNKESAKSGTEIQDATEEQDITTEVENASIQMSEGELLHLQLAIEKIPVPPTTDDQLGIDDARELVPAFPEDQVREEKLKESCNVESGEPGTEIQDSTEKQDTETEEGDASAQMSAGDLLHLQQSIENPPVGISTSTTEAQLVGDDVEELVPALTEDRMGEDEKHTESSNVASEEPATETPDLVEVQEIATEEGDNSAQMSASKQLHFQFQRENSAMQSTTEDQLEINDAKEIAPCFIAELVTEEEKLKESSTAETGETGTSETQDSPEEKDEKTEEGDFTVHMSAGELPHLQLSIENQPEGISSSTTEAQLTGDDARELLTAFTEDRVGDDKKLKESSTIASEKPHNETQNSVKEQEKATDEGNALAQKSVTEDQLMIDDAREAPGVIKEQVREEEKLKESCNLASGEPGTETQESTQEQDKETDERDASAHISAGELHHLQSLIENPSVGISTLMGDDARESVPASTENRVEEEEKLTESSNVASEEPATEIQDSVKEKEKATEQNDLSAQMPDSGQLLLQLQIEKSPKPSASEGQHDTDDARELAPCFTEEQVKEEEKLKESCNAASGELGTETQESTQEQDKETDERDASTHISAGELPHLQSLIENPSVGISTSTTEPKLMGDDARESVPALTEDRVEEEKLTESSNVASEEPATKKQDSVKEQEKATEQNDVSAQMSDGGQLLLQLQKEKSPKPSASEGHLETYDAREAAPHFTEEQVREEEKLKESCNAESGKPGTETQESTEEQEKQTDEIDASAHLSSDELPHLQSLIENPPMGISTSTTEAKFMGDDARESVPALTEDRVEEEKLTESSNVASEEPATKKQQSVEEQEKATEQSDVSAQMSDSEQLLLQLQIEKSPKPAASEGQLETDGARDLAPLFTEEQVREEEKELKESSNIESEEPGTETQDSTQEQDKVTEEGDASAHMSAGELPHLQLSIENPPESISTPITEAQFTEDDLREAVPALTEDRVGAEEKLTELHNVASEEPVTEAQDSMEEQEKATEEGDAFAQKSDSELPHMQLSTEKSPKNTTERQFETDDTKELLPALIEERVREEKIIESSNAVSGEPGTETQGSREEQEEATEEGYTSAQQPSSDLHHLQLSTITSPKHSSTSTFEDKLETDDGRDHVPLANPRDEGGLLPSIGTMTQETIPDQEITQQTDETENESMNNKQDEVFEDKQAAPVAGIEAPSYVRAIENVDDLQKEFIEKETVQAANEEIINEEVLDLHPKKDDTVADELKTLSASEENEVTGAEMESTGNKQEENTQEKETTYENIEDVPECMSGCQETINATDEKQDASKAVSDEQKQQTTESADNLVEVKQNKIDIEKDDTISASIPDNQRQHATGELEGKIITDDDKVNQMIPPLISPKADAAMVKPEDDSNNKISSNIDTHVKDTEIIHDAADEKKEKVPSSICEEQAHEFTNISENIETGFQQEMAATENIGTISESIPEEQNKDIISYASNIITESMTEVDTVDNKISGKVDQDENMENAEINFETNFSKNLADTSDIDMLISETKLGNVGGNNEEPSHKECKENHNTTSTNLTREARVPVKKEEDTEKHEIMSELMPEKQDQVPIDESEPLEVEKRIYDVKVGPISSPESLTESSMQKDENTMLDVEETEKIQSMSEEISEKPEQQTSETETAEAEKRTYDEDKISDSLSSSKNLMEDNMHRDERPTLDVEEHSNESSKVDEILEKQLSEDDKTTNGAILGSSSEEKVESSVTEEEETRKSGICLNQSEVKTENISLDENKDDIIPKDDKTLGGTFDPSTVGEKLDTCINIENEKLKIDDEEGNNVSNSVNIEPKIVYEGCKDTEEQKFEGAATESADRDQDNIINEENVDTTNADPHDKDSNIPTEGHAYERKPESEPENISSAEAESEPALEEEKIAIPPNGDNEDIIVDAKEETEKKLDAYAYNLSHVMVDQADFRSQKVHQIESEKEQNDSTRDVISNQEVESYLKSKEQNLETIDEIDVAKTKATEDDQSKELEYLTVKAGGSSSNGTDDSTATFTLVESSEQVVEKQKDMPSGLSDKTQVPESTERIISLELDLLKGNGGNVGELDKPSILDSEDQSHKHITEIGVIKSDIAECTLPAAEDSTKEKTIDTCTLPEDNNKSHQVKEAEVAPLEEAAFETSMQPQGIVDDKINEDYGPEYEEDVESVENAKNQENAIITEEGYLSRDNDNQENAQASVFDTSETAMEEDVDKVITEMIHNKDTTNKESPGSKIDDLSINYNLDEDNLKGEESSLHPKMDIMEPVILEESEEKCESIIKECQEVHDENGSLKNVLLKDAKESNQQGEQLDKISERGETATSIGGIEKDDLSVVHETACQKDEIVTEHKETRTEPQDKLVVVDSESEVKEVDIVSASSKSKEKPENDLAVSSSEEASATETVVQEPEFATEKTSGAEGSTESAVVSETFTVNSIDGDKAGTNILNDIPNIPEVAKASGEDTKDTKIKEKVAEKEEIAENECSSANDTEDKYLQASSFTQETQEVLPGDANEVVEQVVEASHGVGESENSQNKENQQSNPDDLPVSRFLMDHILQQSDVSNEAGNIKSENKIEENTSDKHMNVSITEQEIVMDPLSAEKVPNENIIGNKDLEKVEHTILEQGNVPDEASDVKAENKIKEENTSDKQKGISIQEQEVIMDSVSVVQIPKEKNISEDNNQKKLEDHILQEVSVPDEVCDVKAENIITEEITNDKHEEISIKEQEVTLDSLSTKKIPKEEDLDKVEVASNLLNEEKRHESGETKEYAENPVTKDSESPNRNICMPSSTTASGQIEIEVPSSLNGVSASIVTDDHKDSTPTEQSFLGTEGVAQECTSSNSVQDEKITAAPIEGKITENSTQKDNNSPVSNACDASLSQDGENTKVFDNVEQTENLSHSISEEQITSATSELLGSTTGVIRSEEPQANTQCEQTELETMKNTEEGHQVQKMKNDSVEEPEESTLEKVQLSDLLLLSRTKITQKTTPAVIKDSEETKESTYTKVEEEKTDEEHKTNDNAAVIVVARDAELKPAHKKSHNILSGVGSKVKHSIAKVKKAITGKSSPQKTISQK